MNIMHPVSIARGSFVTAAVFIGLGMLSPALGAQPSAVTGTLPSNADALAQIQAMQGGNGAHVLDMQAMRHKVLETHPELRALQSQLTDDFVDSSIPKDLGNPMEQQALSDHMAQLVHAMQQPGVTTEQRSALTQQFMDAYRARLTKPDGSLSIPTVNLTETQQAAIRSRARAFTQGMRDALSDEYPDHSFGTYGNW